MSVKRKAAAKAAADKKAAEAKADESNEAPVSWYEEATPTGEYLPKLEGINYYELLSEGGMKVSTIEDREVKSVEFDAIWHETTGIRNKPVAESPEEPIEAILSVPLSVARRIRAEMEEKDIELKSLPGMILALQRTGDKLKTRYPSIELMDKKEYLE